MAITTQVVCVKSFPFPPAPPGCVVVKVGGSLYDHPALGPGLLEYLGALDARRILIVAGGGGVGDAVREWDSVHSLGDEVAHQLALIGLQVPILFLLSLLAPGDLMAAVATETEWWEGSGSRPRVLGLLASTFLSRLEETVGPVPHSWDLTTDSIAAYAAAAAKCPLVLLKSSAIPSGTSWEEAATRGYVDEHFPIVVATYGLQVTAVDFRGWLDGPRAVPDSK
ncbi:hypothetical protein [Fimbriiglobus ruber]|uniref:Delta 1-pyrroline-5-carboxylate synthetase n=1 Tax=Fimbriiglobus ruber TaxID=1908690 RepID=A0A225DRF3_9BACT|nr:hypothetical protein [Fimbriiglobus ruber]OWK43673.1 delta 1-pyrroline-5-carboxylate synthetase [Fimbriiglobus ruber]